MCPDAIHAADGNLTIIFTAALFKADHHDQQGGNFEEGSRFKFHKKIIYGF
jgi:hypothetical protein